MPSGAKIPINRQNTTAIGGLEILHFTSVEDILYDNKLGEHRDDYYVFILAIKGGGTIRCDMELIDIRPRSILLVKPYQVHFMDDINRDSEAWFLSIAPFLVPRLCRDVFEQLPVTGQSLKLPANDMRHLLKIAELLHYAFNNNNAYKSEIINNLLNALITTAASHYLASGQKQDQQRNQAFHITQQFRELIAQYSFLHTASFFAGKLHITTAHLNDSVKVTTGLSVTQFLQHAMLLEAKRSLYYTNADVKKIAYDLGFEDHTYFSRLFKKLTKETPLSFRNKFRE